MSEVFEAKVEKKILSIDEKLADLEKEVGPVFDDKQEYKGYSNLLEKIDMTEKDKNNMKQVIKFLKDEKIDTDENIKKLEAINYGIDYIEIWWVKFSRERFVPDVKFNDEPNEDGVFESGEKGIYKTIHKGKPEYYLTTVQYIAQVQKQWKIAIESSHLRQSLQALPGNFTDNKWYSWWNILWNILGLPKSGCVSLDGKLWSENEYGYLGLASQFNENYVRAFGFNNNEGTLHSHYDNSDARPCLFIVK